MFLAPNLLSVVTCLVQYSIVTLISDYSDCSFKPKKVTKRVFEHNFQHSFVDAKPAKTLHSLTSIRAPAVKLDQHRLAKKT